MKRTLPHPLPDTQDALMKKAGYVRHCVEAGRVCYHRRLNDPPFPRFHALVALKERGMEVDLHFDALDSVRHKSNHDRPWAYNGGRVDEEMRNMFDAMCGKICLKQVYHPTGQPMNNAKPSTKKKRSLFEILFKTM
jgi:hypothetical protein